MGRTRIQFSLTHNSIQHAIEQIKKYRKSLNDKTELLAQKLAERGVKIAQAQIVSYDALFTTELFNSMKTENEGIQNDGYVYLIKADDEAAAFVEFGTGIIGSKNSYKHKLPDGVTWKYIQGKQLVSNIQKGIDGWYYKGDDGNIYFTQGMRSRPFMHDTFIELMSIVEEVAREVFV